jgi:uncharacterized repeat protein (TIGR01451 family)
VQGSCCSSQGSCSHVPSALDCSSNGTFDGNQNCTVALCRAPADPIGACCAATGCLGSTFTLQTCTAASGTFKLGVLSCSAAACPVAEKPDVAVSTGISRMGVLIGGDVTFTMTATNVGNIAATGVRLVGTLPAGLTYGNVPGRWLASASTSSRCLQDSCVQVLAGCCLLSCVFSASHSQLLAVHLQSRAAFYSRQQC